MVGKEKSAMMKQRLPIKRKKNWKPIEKIKLVMTRNKDDEPALYEMLGTKDDRKNLTGSSKIRNQFQNPLLLSICG